MSARSIGEVRPSQVITTFGPGAIVDLRTLSVIVAGIDHWPIDEDHVIHEHRLERALRVRRFFPATPSEGDFFNKRGTVPAYLFPRYQVCPSCGTLAPVDRDTKDFTYDEKRQEIVCQVPRCKSAGKRQATTIPAPFVVACPSGHIDEFPWREFVHKGSTSCRLRLRLYSGARTGTVADLTVECKCGANRSVSAAFGEKGADAIGPCSGRRPWLGAGDHPVTVCPTANDVRAMQRGATNAWFPVVRSALVIRESATPIGIALGKCPSYQIKGIQSLDKLAMYMRDGMFPALNPFPPSEIWDTIVRQRDTTAGDDVDLRWPEWLVLRDGASMGNDTDEFYLEPGEVPRGYERWIKSVVRVRKLLEVRALIGFTRLDPASSDADDSLSSEIAPINRKETDWLPAVQVRGEGIFIELDEGSISEWESKPAVVQRTSAIAEKYREWISERGGNQSEFPGARYVLLHTLAHALMRQISLDCGYSASSIRERIYSNINPDRQMAGILLYTASADSEGSLGGLVDLGAPQRFSQLFTAALESSTRCSSDPLCADHEPEAHATINAAACHACMLASETSCESFNRFLDRNMLVPTIAHRDLAFFSLASSLHGVV